MHVNPQLVPSQVATAFAGAGQAVQEEPQLLIELFSRQALAEPPLAAAHGWYPAAHGLLQTVPSQVAVAPEVVGQAVQEVPQWSTLPLPTQVTPSQL